MPPTVKTEPWCGHALSKGPEREFLLPWLCSAAIVTVIRLLHAADLGYDLTLQIQAGQNILAGRGLTTYLATAQNLADPMELVTLTQFPCGYSLFAAALMALGAGPGMVVKVIGAAATMLGWWGWANLAFAYMGEGWQRDAVWKRVGYFIAIVSPLLFTIPWSGTDILLWAALPWVLRLVVRSPESRSQDSLRMDATAGALTGLCLLMRYASLFLAVYAIFLIICQCRLRMALLFRRAMAFGCGLSPALAIQIYVSYFLASRPAAPDGMTLLNRGILVTLGRAWGGSDHLTPANVSVLFWTPGKILNLFTETGDRSWALAVTAVVLALPALVAVTRNGQKASSVCHPLRIAGAGLFTVVPLFLLACELVDGIPYAVVPRYYWPILPLAVFVAYSLATTDSSGRRQRITGVLRFTGRAYLAGFVMMGCIGIILMPGSGPRSKVRRAQMIGTHELRRWPSFRLTYEFSPARSYVLGLMKAQPGMVFITNREQWFYAEPELDRSRIHQFVPCQTLSATHVTGPARLLVLVQDHRRGPREFYWYNYSGQPRHVECFDGLPPFSVVQRFPDEGLELLEATVPDGVRVTLKDVGPLEK